MSGEMRVDREALRELVDEWAATADAVASLDGARELRRCADDLRHALGLPAPHPQGGTDEAVRHYAAVTANAQAERDAALAGTEALRAEIAHRTEMLAREQAAGGRAWSERDAAVERLAALRAQIEALCDADPRRTGYVLTSDLRALLAAAPAPTEAGPE